MRVSLFHCKRLRAPPRQPARPKPRHAHVDGVRRSNGCTVGLEIWKVTDPQTRNLAPAAKGSLGDLESIGLLEGECKTRTGQDMLGWGGGLLGDAVGISFVASASGGHRVWEGWEGLGRVGKGWEGLGRVGKGWEGLGRVGKGWEGIRLRLF